MFWDFRRISGNGRNYEDNLFTMPLCFNPVKIFTADNGVHRFKMPIRLARRQVILMIYPQSHISVAPLVIFRYDWSRFRNPFTNAAVVRFITAEFNSLKNSIIL